MGTATLPVERNASAPAPLRTGIALAATVAVLYTLCALVWQAAPGPFLAFMNSLFHGMDFTPMVGTPSFSLAGFLLALLVMTIWGFLAGTLFGWVRQLLG